MKLFGLVLFTVLFRGDGLHVNDSAEQAALGKQDTIDAVLALAKSSLSSGQDKVEVLKNAMILLSELRGNDPIDASLSELMAATHEAIENNTNNLHCDITNAEEFFIYYADRHARRLEEVVEDFDCMEREFDVSDPGFDPEEAATVFSKCRLLVLRNVFPKTLMQTYRRKYDDYVYAIHTGKIDRFNTKTTDSIARDIVQHRGRKRHDIILPAWLGGKEFTNNPNILEIMRNEKVLGPEMFLNHLGSVISEPGAPNMHWHADTGYIWSSSSFEVSGIGGHDLPPYAASMFVPLFENVTYDHGPTEFCMGSSHLEGIPMYPSVMNETLVEEGSIFNQMQEFRATAGACPPENWRVPLVDMGDAVIFDYQINHRGGPNKSPESRALLFSMYSRFWFRDGNFDSSYSEEETSEESGKLADEWAAAMRYALVDESEVEHVPEANSVVSSLENFAGITEEHDTTGKVEFIFTNNNVEGAFVSFDDGIQKEIEPKAQWQLKGEIGEELLVRDKAGKVIDSWIIEADQLETILVDRRS